MNQSDKHFLNDELNSETIAEMLKQIDDNDSDLLTCNEGIADWIQLQRDNSALARKVHEESLEKFENVVLQLEAECAAEANAKVNFMREDVENGEKFGEVCGEKLHECTGNKVVPIRVSPDTRSEMVVKMKSEAGKVTHGKKPVGWKKRKKVLLMTAVVAVLGLGTTMMAQGDRWYELKQYPLNSKRNIVANHNAILKADRSSELEAAYKEIEQSLGIVMFELSNIPSKMIFDKLVLDDDYATLKFDFDGKSVYYMQRKIPETAEISDIIISDRAEYARIYNEWLNREIVIERNLLENGFAEYSAGFSEDDVFYYVSGIMDEEIFIDLLKDIHRFDN